MKKQVGISLTALMLVGFSGITGFGAEQAEGVMVTQNSESATGYTIDFCYKDEKATNVQVTGSFLFYESGDLQVWANGFVLPGNDKQANHCINPQEWSAGRALRHLNDVGSKIDMEQTGDGVWTLALDLPGGSYSYQYSVSYDNGENYERISDLVNLPPCNDMGAEQVRSKFYVPYDEKQGEPEYNDWSWVTPIEDEAAQGTVEALVYPGLDGEQIGEIYLPADYDENRETPYKVLYLSHGGGGDEADWFYQGNAGNIVDRLTAEGACEPFIIVCMDITVYAGQFEGASRNDDYYLYCYKNIKEYLIPYVEEHYNVLADAQGRAFAGFSNGAKLTTQIYINDPAQFSYYGMFSGSSAWAWPELEDYSAYKNADIYLAAGWADQLMMQNSYHTDGDKTLMGFKELLDAAEITYNRGGSYVTVEGAHDWFTCPQILRDYVSTTLWK